MHEQTFAYLVFGLGKYFDSEARYPLPDELRFALNQLAYAQAPTYPRTLTGVLHMLAQPLNVWWPGSPPAFDSEATLIYDNALSLSANEYLDELFWRTDLPVGVSTDNFQLALDKLYFKQMLIDLRLQAIQNPESVQQEYVALRRFLIQHPWPTLQELVDEFSWMQHLQSDTVGELYAYADSMQARHLFEGQYWNCTQCGPLIVRRNELRTVKSSVCGVNCPRHTGGWESIPPGRRRLVLKRAHQLSILIPGIPEVELLNWLEDLQASHAGLVGIEPWPGVDSYDLRIVFADGDAWAVDVKDFTDPARLSEAVKRPSAEEGLEWNHAFYVFPSYRLQQRNRHRETVAQIQRKLSRDIDLMDVQAFQRAVMKKLGEQHV